ELRKMAGFIAGLMPTDMKGKSFLERGSKELKERYVGNAKIFNEKDKVSILSTQFMERAAFTATDFITAPLYEKVSHHDDVTKMQYIDIHTWLRGNILTKADKMSMANSLELRVPFVDV
ncbi:asparagine synthase-related protein, partial [Mycobacterium tuberculosis]